MRKYGFFFLVITLFSTSTTLANFGYVANYNSILLDSLITPTLDSLELGDVLVKKDSTDKKDCEVKDIPDLLGELFSGKKEKKKEKKEKIPRADKNVSLMILPNISSNPVTGFLLGVAAISAWHFGPRETTNISLANSTIAFTSKNQIISLIKSGLYTKDNNYFLEGDWRYYKFSASTWGLGTNAPDSVAFDRQTGWLGLELEAGDGTFPMEYNYVIFHQTVNKKIVDNFYAGIGYHLDAYWKIKDNFLNLDTIPKQVTPHWGYSKRHNFDSSGYAVSGLSVNAMFDSRDNQINPYKGYYARLNYRYNATFLGSDQNSSELWAEFRTYVGLSKKTPRHLVAFWVFGNFKTSGAMPYYALMASGEDQKARSGRGYIAGRYRGEAFLYAEAEYRFPILPCLQTLGGVVFLNATTANNTASSVGLFDYVRPALGVGLRVLFSKYTRLNINFDYAIGYKSNGFYFAGGEAF